MSYETRVLVVFFGIVLMSNLAVVVFFWMRTRETPDRIASMLILWRLLSYTAVASGGLVWFVFRDSRLGIAGIVLLALGILSRLANSVAFAAWRRKTLAGTTSGTPPSQ